MRMRLAVRRVLRAALADERGAGSSAADRAMPLALVGLSGGADSLALAAAVAGEARVLGIRAGAIVVDHGLQPGSAEVASAAADHAVQLGLDPVVIRAVDVQAERGGGPEAAARGARYEAFVSVAREHDARWVLTAHTRDDQAEQVLLALARGSGGRSLAGIPPLRELAPGITMLRPFLTESPEITRETTAAACTELGREPWHDPHNLHREYARVRVRRDVLPVMARELGAGVAANLARTADLAREDADALDALADALATAHTTQQDGAYRVAAEGVRALAEAPAALRQRVIRRVAQHAFGTQLTREHTLAVAALVTAWHGQGPIQVPGGSVTRARGALRFAPHGDPRLNEPT